MNQHLKTVASCLLLAMLVTGGLAAQSPKAPPKSECRIPPERRGNTDWFRDAGWGVFVHYLWEIQCVGKHSPISTQGGTPDWNDCVNDFNTEKFATQLQEAGVKYVIFTMMQCWRYMIAPNATYDRMTGYQPGEACSKRDLVEDLYQSLSKRGIKLMLYWTGDGPKWDSQAAKALGYTQPAETKEYVQKWADVVAEYSERYKDKVVGWWVDGCFGEGQFGTDERAEGQEKAAILAKGLRAGNPRRIIGLANGTRRRVRSSTLHEDFTTGEHRDFDEVPTSRWCDGVQWHILSYLGEMWCSPGLRHNPDWMADYIRKCNRVGGVVSIDVHLFRDGTIETSHLECLKGINRHLKR